MNITNIRTVTKKDVNALLKIYTPYVKNTAITFEYDVPSVYEFLKRIKTIKRKYPYVVIEVDGKIKGYAYAYVFKDRDAYRFSVEVSIYVDELERGKGYGKMLYDYLERKLSEMGIKNLYACIASIKNPDKYLSNDSIKFHEQMGYKLIGVFHNCGYKFNRWYDMVWMEKIIGEYE